MFNTYDEYVAANETDTFHDNYVFSNCENAKLHFASHSTGLPVCGARLARALRDDPPYEASKCKRCAPSLRISE